ncbi:MAG TPA: septal ring lytic transglycosylase RlpA family protein [Solirubrobacteraceae bacterium]|nr:septal ring lytic transglycosylase RlpA family protein [Solirubrobacteraceae bacterium]
MAGAPKRTALRLLRDELNVLAGHRARIAGELLVERRPAPGGQLITLQALGRRGWRAVASTRTGGRGRFHLSYSPKRVGSRSVRLRYAGAGPELGSRRRLGWLNVYRLAEASWYGGGGGMACGGELTSSTMGVANKTLPCGTLVTLHYGGRTVRVPVVDRGPYVAGREFDLTEATKAALGFSGVGEVWSTD